MKHNSNEKESGVSLLDMEEENLKIIEEIKKIDEDITKIDEDIKKIDKDRKKIREDRKKIREDIKKIDEDTERLNLEILKLKEELDSEEAEGSAIVDGIHQVGESMLHAFQYCTVCWHWLSSFTVSSPRPKSSPQIKYSKIKEA